MGLVLNAKPVEDEGKRTSDDRNDQGGQAMFWLAHTVVSLCAHLDALVTKPATSWNTNEGSNESTKEEESSVLGAEAENLLVRGGYVGRDSNEEADSAGESEHRVEDSGKENDAERSGHHAEIRFLSVGFS